MSLSPTVGDESVLCDEGIQERSRPGWGHHSGVARPSDPAGALGAGPGWVHGRLTGGATPKVRQGGMPMRAGTTTWAVWVCVGGRPAGLRAGGSGRGGPGPVGDLGAAASGASGDLGDQPGVVVSQGVGLVGGHRLPTRDATGYGGRP